jgi:MFS family permease
MFQRRAVIAIFLFSLAMINYMDRIALSIAAKPIAAQFNISPIGMGYLFSSFIWSYALFLLPMGILIDRFGPRKMAGIGIFIWSSATALTAAVSSFSGLLAARLIMGSGESSSNPVGAKVIRQWFPASERGIVTSVFNSGSYLGPAICTVLLSSLVSLWGWRVSFMIAGGIGFVWLTAWMIWFSSPEEATWLSDKERSKIIEEREPKTLVAREVRTGGLRSLFKSASMWGVALTQGCNVYTQYLALTWLPSYLQASRHLSLNAAGWLTAMPYAVSGLLCILAGHLSDRYLKRDGVGTGRRRNAVALALLAGAAILAVPFVHSRLLLLAVLSIALSGIASTTALNFALLSDLLPNSRDMAKAMAFVVTGGNLFGMVAPIATGYVIASTGSFDWAFGIAGALLVTGALITLTMTRRPILEGGFDERGAGSARLPLKPTAD